MPFACMVAPHSRFMRLMFIVGDDEEARIGRASRPAPPNNPDKRSDEFARLCPEAYIWCNL
jgi:hypothetical protein